MLKKVKIFLIRNVWCIVLSGFLFHSMGDGYSQSYQSKSEEYLFGEKEKLEMIVHIWGEVKEPGEYRVSDNTDVLELISKAGGPTEFSDLKEVILTRERSPSQASKRTAASSSLLASKNGVAQPDVAEAPVFFNKRVIKLNLKSYLEKEQIEALPLLQPGDVIRIKRNSWSRWQTAIRIASQVAIIVQAAYYFSRIYE
ncbi:SLBB domain-containing protein [candidate division KSB1 bacterium]|nr:SLBB domain-containing protein [candidate division KSB1 bacterium]